MKKVMKKLKSSIGFTLSETLMTVLILVMVSGVVAGGVPSAVRAYGKAVEAANAHVALSTTVNALRSELSTAWDVKQSGNDITYFNASTGAKAKLYKANDGTIMVQDFLGYNGAGESSQNTEHELVSKTAVTKNLAVTYGSVSLDGEGNVLHFTNLTVSTTTGVTIETIENLYIRVLTNSLKIPEA